MAELRVLNQASEPLPKERLPMPVQVAAGLEKISLAMKSRTWRREGQAGLGPLQRQVLTLLRGKTDHSAQVSAIAKELVVRLPTASEAVATLERKRLVKRYRSHRDGRIVTVELTANDLQNIQPDCEYTEQKDRHDLNDAKSRPEILCCIFAVSYTHLTLPTIYSV